MYISATNYTAVLASLRQVMFIANLQAYIVPSGDAHYTEFIAQCDERRAFISGFTGSTGTAIVTEKEALVWTDGRYFLQAEQQLDKTLWTLMKEGLPETPSQAQWLKQNLTAGARVGVDPSLYSKRQWDSLKQELESTGKYLVAYPENLVDKVWTDRPACASDPVEVLGLEFAGISTAEKVTNIRKAITANSASALVVAELDEVAWLLNLRGSDIPYSSTFFAFVLLTDVELYFFINQAQLKTEVIETLKMNVPEIQIQDYKKVTDVLADIVNNTSGKIWFNQNTNYELVQLIEPASRQLMQLTPISLMKAVKNPTEVTGYRKALIRDAAALCEFFPWLEEEIAKGTEVTEISAAEKLHSFRLKRENFVNDSFRTISAAGENGAVIHYMPTPETNRRINPTDMYLLDSGGLYRDGTTDITRTIHLGTPTSHQKNAYTRVMKGQMALAQAIFPNKITGHRLDSFARQFLWEVGLDYNHGTGHGIGSFLNVHEGPFSVGSGYSSTDPGLMENFFTSNEPGYYEDNEFGIRLENLVRVKNVSLAHNFQNRGYLGFEDLTFVPYDHKLIDFSLLSEDELLYLNKYQEQTRNLVGGYIRDNEMSEDAYQWMWKATMPVNESGPISESSPSAANWIRLDFILISLPALIVLLRK